MNRLLLAIAPTLLAGCMLHGMEPTAVAGPQALYVGAGTGQVRSALVVEMEERNYFVTWQTVDTVQFERRIEEAGPTAWGNPAPDAVVAYTVRAVPSGVQVVADISVARRYGGRYTRAAGEVPAVVVENVRHVLGEVDDRVRNATGAVHQG